jgi:hypothetical protein
MVKTIKFADYPDFTPNLTPKEIFQKGSFGGTYWRPIYSDVTGKNYKNVHKKYPSSWFKNCIVDLPYEEYDSSLNKYNVKVGTTLEFWEDSGWITKYHPYGWIHWYCDFYLGKRCKDDERQISRWKNIAGPNGRFRKMLINMIKSKKKRYNDFTISPKIRQTLLHWAYEVCSNDCKN